MAMETAKKQKIAKHEGRVQYLAHREVINEMQSQGHNNKSIHKCLVNEHGATMSYHTFCFWMRHFSTQAQQPERAAVKKNPTILPASTTGTPQGKFMRPENVDPKDLF